MISVYDTIEKAIYEWAVLVLPTNTPIIWYHENAPRPIVPYVALYISTVSSIGWDFVDGKGNLTGNRDFTLLCQGIGKYSMDFMETMKTSLEKPAVQLFLRSKEIAFVERLAISCISEVVDNRWEERHILDLKFRFAQLSTDTSGIVEHANIKGAIKNIDLSTVKSVNITL